MRPPTKKELLSLTPHLLTLDDPWDPTNCNEEEGDELFYDSMTIEDEDELMPDNTNMNERIQHIICDMVTKDTTIEKDSVCHSSTNGHAKG